MFLNLAHDALRDISLLYLNFFHFPHEQQIILNKNRKWLRMNCK